MKPRRRLFVTLVLLMCAMAACLASRGAQAAPGPLALEAAAGPYVVTLEADGDAVPEGTTLAVDVLGEGDATYEACREAVGADDATLGMAVLDVRLLDPTGAEVEPTSPVTLLIALPDLPDEAVADAGYDVTHVTSTESGADATLDPDLTAQPRPEVEGSSVQTEVMATSVTPDDTGATVASFETSSLSPYVVTWVVDTARVGHVDVHYADATGGNELARTTEVSAADLSLAPGSILDVASWASDGTVTGRTLSRALLGTRTAGTEVTALRVTTTATASGTTAYRLQWTADDPADGPTWHDWDDAATNADLWLLFDEPTPTPETCPVTVSLVSGSHAALVDQAGTPLTLSFDAAATFAGTSSSARTANAASDLAAWLAANAPAGYAFPTSTVNTSSSATGHIYRDGTDDTSHQFRFLAYYDSVLHWGKGNVGWTAFEGTPAISATLAASSAYPVTVIYVSGSGDVLSTETVSVADGGTLDATALYVPAGWHLASLATADGTDATTLAWATTDGVWGTTDGTTALAGPVSAVTATCAADPSLTVTVHHVDALGDAIADDTTLAVSDGTTLAATDVTAPAGYDTAYARTLVSDGAACGSITWSYDGTSWTASSDTATLSDPTTVTVRYVPTGASGAGSLRFHHVDTAGDTLAADTAYATGYAGATTWDGWTLKGTNGRTLSNSQATGVGTYVEGRLGSFASGAVVPIGSAVMVRLEDGTWHTGVGLTTNATTKAATVEFMVDGGPALVTDVWQVYSGYKAVTVHHVDATGALVAADTRAIVASGATQTASTLATTVAGMVPSSLAAGDRSHAVGSTTWTVDAGGTWTDDADWPAGIVREVWVTYGDGAAVTIHPVGADGTSVADDVTATLATGDSLSLADLVPDVAGLAYDRSRLGASTGAIVTDVSCAADGTLTWSRTATMTLDQTDSRAWSGTTGDGRTVSVTTDAEGLTLADSLGWTLALDASPDGTWHATRTTDDAGSWTYMLTPAGDAYVLTGTWVSPVHATEAWATYLPTSDLTLSIDDDVVWTGRLLATPSDALASALSSATGVTYAWHRVVTTDAGTTDEVVTRRSAGDAWNVAAAASERTWLDVSADEGDEAWSVGTAVSYHVTLDYALDGVSQPTVTSPSWTLPYYGLIENGSFEVPSLDGSTLRYYSDAATGTRSYRVLGGVWRTTGLGTGTHVGDDIEIVSTAPESKAYLDSYGFPETSVEGAADGEQFAELNAESAGAMYQDVLTHAGEVLSYGYAHRARGGAGTRQAADDPLQYDTMYVVIMPTSVALTAAADGGPLETQAELEAYVADHGGLATAVATSEEDVVTWRDDADGVVIRRVSSDDWDWHVSSVVSDYVARAPVTRFFFVAGPTAWSQRQGQSADRTHGNMLDAVWFSQGLPPTDGFDLTVTKAFTGLSQEALAGLAGTFEVTLDDTAADAGVADNEALDGATLGFSATRTGASSWSFEPTATAADGTDLMASGTCAARATLDGTTLTLSWTFAGQPLEAGGDDLSDESFDYVATETGMDVGHARRTSVATATSTTGVATPGTTSASVRVARASSATIALANAYEGPWALPETGAGGVTGVASGACLVAAALTGTLRRRREADRG